MANQHIFDMPPPSFQLWSDFLQHLGLQIYGQYSARLCCLVEGEFRAFSKCESPVIQIMRLWNTGELGDLLLICVPAP
jgi:hypothetical protein